MNLDWNWQGAEIELKRGIDMNPNNGHIDYSFYLTIVGRPGPGPIRSPEAPPDSLSLKRNVMPSPLP